MKNKRCLYCYKPIEKEADFHIKCCQLFFGTTIQPELDLPKQHMHELANEIVSRSIAITGVQPKLSLDIEKLPGDNKNSRMTIVGLWGQYILKPQSEIHLYMPENEDLTMHLAKIVGINTADHSLIRLKSGELAYITKRFDRVNNEKIQCEDLCQLSELLTEYKYRSSMEKTGKKIKQYVTKQMLDTVTFFEIALFSFLVGNSDMHLKNFSILKDKKGNYNLSPAYDLLNTKLTVPEDLEEMALTINARKNKITRKDFDTFAKNLGMNEKQTQNVYHKFDYYLYPMLKFIDISFLPDKLKEGYKNIICDRSKRLSISKFVK